MRFGDLLLVVGMFQNTVFTRYTVYRAFMIDLHTSLKVRKIRSGTKYVQFRQDILPPFAYLEHII